MDEGLMLIVQHLRHQKPHIHSDKLKEEAILKACHLLGSVWGNYVGRQRAKEYWRFHVKPLLPMPLDQIPLHGYPIFAQSYFLSHTWAFSETYGRISDALSFFPRLRANLYFIWMYFFSLRFTDVRSGWDRAPKALKEFL